MADESPVMEEPKEPTDQDVSVDDAKAILEELDDLGIDSVEKVQNMAIASGESGRLAQMLGEVRQQNESLQKQIHQLTTQSQQPQYDEYGQPAQQSIGANDIKQAVREVYQNDILGPQVEQANRIYGELAEIQNNPRCRGAIKEIWEKHWNNPNTQHKVMSNQTSPTKEFNDVVMTYLDQALLKIGSAYKGVVEKKATPPHVESGDQTHVHTPTQDDETKEKVKKIQEKSQGGHEDIEAIVKAFLPSDDPMFK